MEQTRDDTQNEGMRDDTVAEDEPPTEETTQEMRQDGTHEEHMEDENETEDKTTEQTAGDETDDLIMDGLVDPDGMEVPEENEDEADPTLHSEPIQPTIIKMPKDKRKHKLDQSCQSFLGKCVGGTHPLSLPSYLRVVAANYGGKLKPWGESGHTISENRLDPSMELIRWKHADMILLAECHAEQPVASQMEEHGRLYNYFAIVAPTSTNTAKAIDEFGDASKRTPSAGVAALLSPELAKRVML
jgi:hypothetical protein